MPRARACPSSAPNRPACSPCATSTRPSCPVIHGPRPSPPPPGCPRSCLPRRLPTAGSSWAPRARTGASCSTGTVTRRRSPAPPPPWRCCARSPAPRSPRWTRAAVAWPARSASRRSTTSCPCGSASSACSRRSAPNPVTRSSRQPGFPAASRSPTGPAGWPATRWRSSGALFRKVGQVVHHGLVLVVLGPAERGGMERAVFEAGVGAVLDEIAHHGQVSVERRAVQRGLLVRAPFGSVDVEAKLGHEADRVEPVPVGGDTDLAGPARHRPPGDAGIRGAQTLHYHAVGPHACPEEFEFGVWRAWPGASRVEDRDYFGVAVQHGQLPRGAAFVDRVPVAEPGKIDRVADDHLGPPRPVAVRRLDQLFLDEFGGRRVMRVQPGVPYPAVARAQPELVQQLKDVGVVTAADLVEQLAVVRVGAAFKQQPGKLDRL